MSKLNQISNNKDMIPNTNPTPVCLRNRSCALTMMAPLNTVDKCYYLIGFLVGHKFHGKDVQPPNRTRKFATNQIGTKSSQAPIKTVQTSYSSLQFI